MKRVYFSNDFISVTLSRGPLALFLLLLTVSAAPQDRAAQFRPLAAELAERRLAGGEESEGEQARALQLADAVVLGILNAGAPTTDDVAPSGSLETLLAQPPRVGESYQLMRLGPPSRPWYLLAANVGLAGPSAVRIYARPPSSAGYRLVARIDRFSQADYFDEFLSLALVAPAEGVFVTVTGRTDELETGGYIAWHFDGERLERLWATDLLERSRYEVAGGEFRVTYCEESDDDDPSRCARMLRERFAWRGGQWLTLERREIKP
ncbi:MAG: hypothetical protein ACRD5G_10270 [Candidatus Acidiferrales bacterium]